VSISGPTVSKPQSRLSPCRIGRLLVHGQLVITVIWGVLLAAMAVHADATTDFGAPPATAFGDEPIAPIPFDVASDPNKVALGEKLFHDVRLSRGNVVACASCHRLSEGGDDNRAQSISRMDGKLLNFNSPTVFNVGLNFRLNWRGNFRTLEEQNEVVLLDPRLMNTTWDEIITMLRSDPDYKQAFAAIYGGDPERAHVLNALATFERALLTPNGRFDQYLRGERGAITEAEENGYQLFKAYGCTACHQGMNIGGNLFQKFGIFQAPYSQGDSLSKADLGRFTLTGRERDRYVFRVPSLRNVGVTAPYFHDGSASTLEQAVTVMGRKQLGRILTEQDINLIVKFLHTLTGDYQGQPLTPAAEHPP
jgi:cytochrome c peroxidase